MISSNQLISLTINILKLKRNALDRIADLFFFKEYPTRSLSLQIAKNYWNNNSAYVACRLPPWEVIAIDADNNLILVYHKKHPVTIVINIKITYVTYHPYIDMKNLVTSLH